MHRPTSRAVRHPHDTTANIITMDGRPAIESDRLLPQRDGRSKVSLATNTIVHFLLLSLTFFVTYICFYKGTVLFSWHPPFMLLGFFVLMTEAVLCFCDNNVPTLGLSHRQRSVAHWVMQVFAGCSIATAFVIIILNKNRLGKTHFTSNHGILGLTSIVCASLSICGGVATLFSNRLRHFVPPIASKIGHAAFSVCTYVLAMTTIILGLYSPWFLEENTSYTVVTVCIVNIVLVAAYTVVSPLVKTFNRVRRVISR